MVGDFDGNGRGDFVIASRTSRGRIELWRSMPGDRFERSLIEATNVRPEAGGAAYDIDRDGDLDLVLGQDSSGQKLFWWENPSPRFDRPWTRRDVSTSAATKHHDQLFADVDADGITELVSWNQGTKSIFVYEIPKDPRTTTSPWSRRRVHVTKKNCAEGLAFADIDGDGRGDLLADGSWFKFANGKFTEFVIDASTCHARIAVGQLIPGGRPEVVIAAGDSIGQVFWYEWSGQAWTRRWLRQARHAHTVEIADLDGDGHRDVLIGEMKLGAKNCELAVYRGDSRGGFTRQTIATGNGIHEGKLVDVDADGDLDLVHKPYNDGTPRIDVWWNTSRTQRVDAWQRTLLASLGARALYCLPGDIDGDGWSDIATGDSWYRHPGSTTRAWTRASFGAPLRNVALLADLDGDGDLDAFGTQGVGSAKNAKFAWAENDGSGRFRVHTNIPDGRGDFLQGVALGRFSGDQGPLSIALSWHQAGVGVQLLTIPAQAKATPWTWRRISSVSQDEDLSTGDIDGDGDLDLLLGTVWLENPTWRAHTLGRVSDLTKIGGTPTPDRNALADMDSDGDLDAVVSLENGGDVVWFENPRPKRTASTTWARRRIGWSPGQGFSMDVGDIDRDGDPDVIVGEHRGANENRIFLFLNDDPKRTFRVRTLDRGPKSTIDHHDGTQLHDVDGDGDLDICSIGWNNAKLWIWTNGARSVGNKKRRTAAPRVDPANATFLHHRVVRIASASTAAVIRYTLDGSPVTATSTRYVAPIRLTKTTSLRARAFERGLEPSTEIRTSYAQLDDSLSWYAFDELVGTTSQDRGLANETAIAIGATRTNGYAGAAFEFDGGSARVEIPTPALTSRVTITAWIRADRFDHLTARDARVVSQATGPLEREHGVMLSTLGDGDDVVPRFRLRTKGRTTTLVARGAALPIRQWTHLAATYDGKEMRLFVDGEPVAARTVTGPVTLLPNTPTWIGNNPRAADKGFDGILDEVRIWNRDLDAREIRALGRESRRPHAFYVGHATAACRGLPVLEIDDELAAGPGSTTHAVAMRRAPASSFGFLFLSGPSSPVGFELWGARLFVDPSSVVPLPLMTDTRGEASTQLRAQGLPARASFLMQAVFLRTAFCNRTNLFASTSAFGGIILPQR